jgi:class 3 adenylate cyclase
VLFDVIARINPAFLQRIDRANVVGYDRPWREAVNVDRPLNVRQCCVLKADVQSFASLMRAGVDAPVRTALEQAVLRWAPAASIREVRAGDAAVIVADDPVALAQTARHLMDEVYQAPGQPRLRIALHYGEVHTRQCDTDLSTEVAGGDAILCSARVEPLVEPGQIWATEEFRQQFLERPSLWRTSLLTSPSGEELFNVKKKGSQEPDSWMRLYRLES